MATQSNSLQGNIPAGQMTAIITEGLTCSGGLHLCCAGSSEDSSPRGEVPWSRINTMCRSMWLSDRFAGSSCCQSSRSVTISAMRRRNPRADSPRSLEALKPDLASKPECSCRLIPGSSKPPELFDSVLDSRTIHRMQGEPQLYLLEKKMLNKHGACDCLWEFPNFRKGERLLAGNVESCSPV